MKWTWVLVSGLIVATAGAWWTRTSTLRACGPIGVEAVFRDTLVPDTDPEEWPQGRLGILRKGLPLEHLVCSFRHLAGLPMEPAAWRARETAPPEDPEAGLKRWGEARSLVENAPSAERVKPSQWTDTYVDYPHIGNHALQTAAATLTGLVKQFGARSPEVHSWLQAQDQVFRGRPDNPQIPAPVSAPDWLRRERDYQRSAALFYAARWEEARMGFAAIASDPDSPWRHWGAYLQARCWTRQASLGPEPAAAPLLKKAQQHLEALLKDAALKPVHDPARAYLELVQYRLEPERLEAKALETLVRPGLSLGEGEAALVMLRESRQAMQKLDKPALPVAGMAAELRDWLSGMEPGKLDVALFESRWKEKPSLPWIVAGLTCFQNDDHLMPELEAAARTVISDSPAAPTLRWHLLRHELLATEPNKLAKKLQVALKDRWPTWAANELSRFGRDQARNLDEFGTFLTSRIVEVKGIEWDGPRPGQPPALPEETAKHYGANPGLIETEVAASLNRWLPLDRWVELSEQGGLSRELREDLAHAAWVRAMLLGKWTLERRLRSGLTPNLVKQLESDYEALDPSTRDFRFALLLMKHPGLSPFLHGEMGRDLDGWADLTTACDFGTNWWCMTAGRQAPSPAPGFLTEAERRQATQEFQKLESIPSIRHWMGRIVLSRLRSKPEDPDLPYALHRFVRITRNADCGDGELSGLSRDCFRVLHKHYPRTTWAQKTPVHY